MWRIWLDYPELRNSYRVFKMPNLKPTAENLEELTDVLERMEELLLDAQSLAREASEQQARILLRLDEANQELIRLRKQAKRS